MLITLNNEVIGSWKSPNDASYPPLLLNVSWRERTARIMWPYWYGKPVTVFVVVAIAAGGSLKYQSFVYGSFVWDIHVGYNNI